MINCVNSSVWVLSVCLVLVNLITIIRTPDSWGVVGVIRFLVVEVPISNILHFDTCILIFIFFSGS
jgi:hypothetical protein